MSDSSFRLLPDFLEKYRGVEPPFGFRDAGGNSLGEIAYVRTYSRLKDNGNKETWEDAVQRVTDATYTIQKQYVKKNKLEWNDQKAQASAKEFFDRLFNLKFTPPGRGLQQMGSPQVMSGNSASLQNCGYVSTSDIERHDPGRVFEWAMLALMYGIGIGADTLGSKKNIEIRERHGEPTEYVVPDSREGWAESLRLLINSYLRQNKPIKFDYSLIRPKGAPLVSFGGKASGPDPLKRLHSTVEKIFDERVGRTLDSETITDIFNLIGACVIAGSTRRSAEIILGEYEDGSFLNLKNADRYPERNSYNPDSPGWSWASNNSVKVPVGADYSKYVDGIVSNGEPGLVWLDVIRSRGRMADKPDEKDVRASGVNPCLVYETLLLTDDGLRMIGDLAESGEEFAVCNGDGKFSDATAFYTGERKVYTVSLSNGLSIDLTENHVVEIMSKRYDTYSVPVEMEVSQLEVGMHVRPFFNHEVWSGGTEVDGDTAIALGLLFGDGYVQKNGGASAYIKTREQEVIDFLANYFGSKFHALPDGMYRIEGGVDFVGNYGFSLGRLNSRVLSPQVLTWSANSVRALFKGIWSANGAAQSKYNRISLKMTNRESVDMIQRLASALGYNAYTTTNAPQEVEWSNGMYVSCESYDLNIQGPVQYRKFQDEVGFLHKHKSIDCVSVAEHYHPKTITISSIEYKGLESVYDFNEPITSFGWANGIKVHNCGEQNLESFELCTLSTVHLQNAESKEDFLRTLKFAFLYAKTVTLMPSPWTKTNSIMQRNRRIGLSLTGLTDVIDAHGLPNVLDWMEAGYKEVRRLDRIYSEWLCVRESNRVTTIKPEGSVSLLSGASPGVHWGPGGKFYLRAIRFGNSDPMLQLFKWANYKVEPDLVSDDTSVVYFPMKTNSSRSEKDVSVFEKIGLAAKAQHHWSDNGVSVTVSFDPEKEKHLLVPALRLHEGSLKAVSFLPMANDVYPQQPYTQITEEEYESYKSVLMKIDFSAIYDGVENLEAQGEKFCSNDSCQI